MSSNRHIHRHVMQALDSQADLINWWGTSLGQRYGRVMSEQIAGSRGFTTNGPDAFAKEEAYRLSHSPLYWVEKDMVLLLSTAAKTIKSKRLWPDDLPSPTGFVVFEQPIYLPDRHGNLLGVKAISWGRSAWRAHTSSGETIVSPFGGVNISFYTDVDDQDDHTNQQLLAEGWTPEEMSAISKLSLFHHLPWGFGTFWDIRPDGNYTLSVPAVRQDLFAGLRTEDDLMRLCDEIRQEKEDELPPESTISASAIGAGWFPLVDTLWTMLQQKITYVGQHQPDRHTIKRAKKVIHEPKVMLVMLRKLEGEFLHDTDPDVEPRLVNWTHRWIVEGFWRWQWYPSLRRHVRIWIAPFIKGPADRPLVVKDKAYVWKR